MRRFGSTGGIAEAPGEAAADAAGFWSWARLRARRIENSNRRFCSRLASVSVVDLISTSSGRLSQAELLPTLRSSSETRSLLWAMPLTVTFWASWRTEVRYRPSGGETGPQAARLRIAQLNGCLLCQDWRTERDGRTVEDGVASCVS